MSDSRLHTLEPLVATLNEVLRCGSLKSLGKCVADALPLLGFDGFCMTLRLPSQGWAADPDLTNWPVEGMSEYVRDKFYECDPALEAMMRGDARFIWHCRQTYHCRDRSRFMDFLRESTVRSGCVINLSDALIGDAVLSVSTGVVDTPSPEITDAVDILGSAVALSFAKIQQKAETKTPADALSLSSRQLDIVCWIAEGKTNAEIAHVLGLTERNVIYHVGEIFRKLGVQSRLQVVTWYLKKFG